MRERREGGVAPRPAGGRAKMEISYYDFPAMPCCLPPSSVARPRQNSQWRVRGRRGGGAGIHSGFMKIDRYEDDAAAPRTRACAAAAAAAAAVME